MVAVRRGSWALAPMARSWAPVVRGWVAVALGALAGSMVAMGVGFLAASAYVALSGRSADPDAFLPVLYCLVAGAWLGGGGGAWLMLRLRWGPGAERAAPVLGLATALGIALSVLRVAQAPPWS